MPGLVATVVRGGQVVYQRCTGLADVEHRVPNSPDTVYHLASVSKQFTGFAVALLERAGRLALSDDVRSYVPELPDCGRAITVEHLVRHTSGLRDYIDLLMFAGYREEDVLTNDDVREILWRQQGLNFAPGEAYSYSNSGYHILALIVERVTGMPFAVFCRKEIFVPLGMTNTRFQDSYQDVIAGRAYSYAGKSIAGLKRVFSVHGTPGAGCLYTTATDLVRWVRNHDRPIVGGRALIERLQEPGRLNDGSAVDYGFGQLLGRYRGTRVVHHYGADAGYRIGLARFPDEDLAVLLLSNWRDVDPEDVTLVLADVFLAKEDGASTAPSGAAQPKTPFRAPTQEETDRLAGDYLCAEHGSTWTLRAEEGKLLLLIGKGLEMETDGRWIRAAGYGHIRMEILEREGSGRPELGMPEDSGPWIYEPVPAFVPTHHEASEYVGMYVCSELGAVNKVAVADDGGLEIWQPKWGRSPLLAVTRDAFSADLSAQVGYLFTENIFFDRDETGRVAGFRIYTYTSGMRNMPFARICQRSVK
jgi:CubicO group peptidase (beta-lactamase class C family)